VHRGYSLFLFFVVFSKSVSGQVVIDDTIVTLTHSKKSLEVFITEEVPKIDGILNDKVWKTAPYIDEFYQREPNNGAPVSKPTKVYVCYDEKTLYFGFQCYDDPDKITAKELLRDISLAEDDRVQVILDTYLDGRNGFWFQIGPLGSIGDALVSDNGAGFNKQWDGIWEGKAKITDYGWEAEMAIPFKTLNFRPDKNIWGLKLIRHIRRNLESSYWPEANLNTYRFQVSDAGHMKGMNGMSQGFGLDVQPYALIGVEKKQDESGVFKYDIGGDAFYQISSGLNAALTINTDFAQTEVDDRQINLTRFSLFFPEKRDFFLDGANYFNFGFNTNSENRNGQKMIPYFSRRIGLDEDGNPIPIVVGFKMIGQAGNWNIGALNSTQKTDSSYQNFTVARVSHNIGKQSYIGMIGTNGNAVGPGNNWLAGLDFKIGTATFRGNKNLMFTGYAVKSKTEGFSGDDYSFGAEVNYPNDFLNFNVGYQQIGKNYVAGLGFVPRPGIRESFASLFLGPRPNKYGIMKINIGGMLDYITDMENKLLTRDVFLKIAEFEFLSGEVAEYSISNTYEYLDDDFYIYPEDSIWIDQGKYTFWQQGVELSTAPRRRFWIATEINWGDFYDGNRTDIEVKAGMKIGIPFFVGMEFEQNRVKLSRGSFTTNIYRIKADVYFSPDITLTNFVQYDNLSDAWGWQSRFQWILKPGNEIHFVWNSLVMVSLERNEYQISENSALLKVNYNFRF
jgi:hypothetical protein